MRDVDLIVPVGADDQHRHLRQQRGEVLGQQQRRLVGPVQVLEDEQERLRLRAAGHELAEAVPQVAPGELGRQLHGRGDVGEQPAQGGGDARDLRGDVAERLPQRERATRAGARLLDHLHVRQVRRCAVHVDAVAGQDPHAARLGFAADLVDQPGLPYPGLAHDQGQSAVAGQRLVDRPAQVRLLDVPAHQRRQRRCHVARPLHRCGLAAPGHLEQAPPLVEPLEPEQSRVDEPPHRLGLGLLPNDVGDEDLTARRLGRDPGDRVHRLAVQVTVAHADLSDVDADADADLALCVRGVVLLLRPLDPHGTPDRGRR